MFLRTSTMSMMSGQSFRETYAFTCQIQLLAFQFRKDLKELLHETDELSSNIVLILSVWNTLRKPRANRLFNPKDGRKVGPAVFIHRWFGLTQGPTERLQTYQ